MAFQGCDPVIANNLILENHAEWYGGGLHLRQWSDGLIENNQIVGNDAMLGAGVHITYTSSPTVRGNLIQGNIASGLGGGGIYAYYYSNPLIEQNTIMQNESANGAGIAVFWSSAPVIRNNLIARNVSGGGIRIKSSTPEIVHNTITGNYWGGVECYPGSDAVISHNIISSNRFGYGIFVDYDCEPNIGYNNVWGNGAADYGIYLPDQTGINGNISVDPGFVDSDSNDYHLNCDSKCINAGDANFSGEGLTDFDNHARVAGGRADLGADEVPAAWNITKDKQYEKIQEAVDDANDYEVILVTKGTHTGEGNRDISFAGKAVTVQSIDPNDTEVVRSTIIDCEGSGAAPHRAFQFFNQEQADSVVAGLTITNGEGFYEGGAIRCFNNSNPTIRNCVLTKNIARGRGGAIYCDRSSPTIVDCTITENTCPLGYGGGIGCYYGSEPLISNCVVANNMAEGPGRHGGGICCWDQGDAVVANCIVVGNSAWHRGGGLYAYWSRPTFVNCTVIGNRSAEGGGVGCFRESNPEVINCIVRGNRAADGNQLALISTMRVWGLEIITEMTVSHSNIEGGRPEMCVILHWGQGNIDIDANFVDLGYWDDANTPAEPNDDFFVCGNYHLLPGSGCEDAGDNNSVPV
ncbi:MAG: right-handed parallel beta-helix repeat-containing protein, partial [Planctomycetota bacterium]